MTRACMGALIAIALAGGLALRFARLDARPMHHDEANQAVKFGTLLETAPDVTVEQVLAATEAALEVPERVPAMML